jgi:hypothetical protein
MIGAFLVEIGEKVEMAICVVAELIVLLPNELVICDVVVLVSCDVHVLLVGRAVLETIVDSSNDSLVDWIVVNEEEDLERRLAEKETRIGSPYNQLYFRFHYLRYPHSKSHPELYRRQVRHLPHLVPVPHLLCV